MFLRETLYDFTDRRDSCNVLTFAVCRLFRQAEDSANLGVVLSRRLPDLHLQGESPASRYVLTSPSEVGDVPSIVDMEAPAL